MKSSFSTGLVWKVRLIAVAVLMLSVALGMSPDESGAALQSASPPVNDAVARLQRRLDHGSVSLTYDRKRGYLESVLRELRVPIDSQGLVFSKTSFQASRISPANPRAIYFNDDLYVGWVPGGEFVEIASIDATLGSTFYVLQQQSSDRPRFVRQESSCLQCHQSSLTGDQAGLLMRSVYPDAQGMPILSAGTFATTDQSPFKERWGGWYADAKSVIPRGMANGISDDLEHPEAMSPVSSDFSRNFDTSIYLGRHSDVVALLVLAHQTRLHNLLTQARAEILQAIQEQAAMDAIIPRPAGSQLIANPDRVAYACEPVVRSILFCGESFSGQVEGSSGFRKNFESLGPRDHLGRSLRDFDLKRRMFRYPCSYLIYSDQFNSLPAVAIQYIDRRLWQILTGREDQKEFDYLSDADRDAIYDILFESRSNLPAYWKKRH